MPWKCSKTGLEVTLLDRYGNDVTEAAVQAAAAPVVPVSVPQPSRQREEALYGEKVALRRQHLLHALGAKVWWYMGEA